MTFLFGAITVVCFFGSLSIVFPNIHWRDMTYFFRENKKEYLRFSNQFSGKYLLVLGCISLIHFIISFFVTFNISKIFVFSIFFTCLIIGRICLEVAWRNYVKQVML